MISSTTRPWIGVNPPFSDTAKHRIRWGKSHQFFLHIQMIFPWDSSNIIPSYSHDIITMAWWTQNHINRSTISPTINLRVILQDLLPPWIQPSWDAGWQQNAGRIWLDRCAKELWTLKSHIRPCCANEGWKLQYVSSRSVAQLLFCQSLKV